MHFLYRCTAYQDIREEFYRATTLDENDPKVKNVLFGCGSKVEVSEAVRYIRRAMARRARMVRLL